MLSNGVILLVAASVAMMAFIVQGAYADNTISLGNIAVSSDIVSWVDKCEFERGRWTEQNQQCLNTTADEGSNCFQTSRFLQRECTNFCHGDSGTWPSHYSICRPSEMTCENAWQADNTISGCKNVAAPPKWDECPDCISFAWPYFDCLRDELEKLKEEKCNEENGGSCSGLFSWWVGGFCLCLLWQYIL